MKSQIAHTECIELLNDVQLHKCLALSVRLCSGRVAPS